jgi:hypothetical protein
MNAERADGAERVGFHAAFKSWCVIIDHLTGFVPEPCRGAVRVERCLGRVFSVTSVTL